MNRLLLTLLFFVFSSATVFSQDMVGQLSGGINSIRHSLGLSELRRDARLDSAAKSQADWMCSVDRMDHLREPPRSLGEYRICEYHPANRVVKSGYFEFDDLFLVNYNDRGAEVHPRPAANTLVGEIIAAGRGGDSEIRRPDLILQGWMNSPGHRQAISTPDFREFGVGVAFRPGAIYCCVVFANRGKR